MAIKSIAMKQNHTREHNQDGTPKIQEPGKHKNILALFLEYLEAVLHRNQEGGKRK